VKEIQFCGNLNAAGHIMAPPDNLLDEIGSLTSPNMRRIKPSLKPLLNGWTGIPGYMATMPHIKSFCRYKSEASTGKTILDWFLLCSHNFSRPAWGQKQKNKETGETQLSIESFEVGVLFMPSHFLGSEGGEGTARPFSNTPTHSRMGFNGIVNTQKIEFDFEPQFVVESEATEVSSGGENEIEFQLPYDLSRTSKYVKGDIPWVSERSERALTKTSILAMNHHPRNGYRHNIMATSTSKLTLY